MYVSAGHRGSPRPFPRGQRWAGSGVVSRAGRELEAAARGSQGGRLPVPFSPHDYRLFVGDSAPCSLRAGRPPSSRAPALPTAGPPRQPPPLATRFLAPSGVQVLVGRVPFCTHAPWAEKPGGAGLWPAATAPREVQQHRQTPSPCLHSVWPASPPSSTAPGPRAPGDRSLGAAPRRMDWDSRAGARLQDPFLSLAAPRLAPLGCGAFAGGGGLGVRGRTEALVTAPCSGPMHVGTSSRPAIRVFPFSGQAVRQAALCVPGSQPIPHGSCLSPAGTHGGPTPQAPEPEAEGVGSRPPDPAAFTRGRGAGSSVVELKSPWDVM